MFTAGIDADDRVYIESDTQSFDVDSAAYGFPTTVTSVGGGPWRATATTNWDRGVLPGAEYVRITPTGGGGGYNCPTWSVDTQSVPVRLRSNDTSRLDDADYVDRTLTLQYLDNDVNDPTQRRITWGINDNGHVFRAWPPGLGISPSWPDLDFAHRLGFDGTESMVIVGSVRLLTGNNPCPGVIVPSRPVDNPVEGRSVGRLSATALNGAVYNVEHSNQDLMTISWFLDGPQDFGDDLWVHYLRRFLPYAHNLVTYYQQWGDTRRQGHELLYQDYSLLRTQEQYRGRMICRLAPGSSATTTLEKSNRLRRRSPITTRLAEDPENA